MWTSSLIRKKITKDFDSHNLSQFGVQVETSVVADEAMKLLSDRGKWEKFRDDKINTCLTKKDKRLNYLIHCKTEAIRKYRARYEARHEGFGATTWGVWNHNTQSFFERGYTQAYAEQYADDLNDHLATKYRDPEFDLERLA
jgi:hypothetical protein